MDYQIFFLDFIFGMFSLAFSLNILLAADLPGCYKLIREKTLEPGPLDHCFIDI
jgi:hypothetical protein